MATIGQALTSPEAGWIRFDDSYSSFTYESTWNTVSSPSYYGGNIKNTIVNGALVKFNFTGTKIRIIAHLNSSGMSNNVMISIDGVEVSYSQVGTSLINQALVYEKTGLENKEHYVTITNKTTSTFSFDAIDIDVNATLKPYKKPVHKACLQSSSGEVESLQVGSYSNNVIPIMLSNTTPSGVVESDSVLAANTQYQAFDGKSNTSYQSASNIKTGYLSYTFTEHRTIGKYTITPFTNWVTMCPVDWTFEAYVNGAWVELDKRVGVTDWVSNVKKEFVFDKIVKSDKYRINVSKNNGSTQWAIGEMEMMEILSYSIKSIPSHSELDFIRHGMNVDYISNINTKLNITLKTFIQNQSATLDSGRIFTQPIDLSGYRVNKITFL